MAEEITKLTENIDSTLDIQHLYTQEALDEYIFKNVFFNQESFKNCWRFLNEKSLITRICWTGTRIL